MIENKGSHTFTADGTIGPFRCGSNELKVEAGATTSFGSGTLTISKRLGLVPSSSVTDSTVFPAFTISTDSVGDLGVTYNIGAQSEYYITMSGSTSPNVIVDFWAAENDNA